MLVLGVTGKAVSGKSSVAEYLAKKYGFIHLDFTKDLLAPMLTEKHKAVVRKNLINLGMEIRKKQGGKDALIRLLAAKIDIGHNYVIAGIRFPEEVNYLRNKFNYSFKLLAVKCDLKIRYQRTLELYHIKRKTVGGRDLTFKEFLNLEDEPTEKIIGRTMRMADFSVTNEGVKRELFEKIDNLMKRLKV